MSEQLVSDQNERMTLITDHVFKVLRRKGLKRADVVLTLRSDWKSIAPGRWVNARPIVLIEGRLSVIAPSKMEMAVLRYSTPNLMKCINARFGPDTVADVNILAPRRIENESERS